LLDYLVFEVYRCIDISNGQGSACYTVSL